MRLKVVPQFLAKTLSRSRANVATLAEIVSIKYINKIVDFQLISNCYRNT